MEQTAGAGEAWPFTGEQAPLVLFFGAGASAAPPLKLPTSAEFFRGRLGREGLSNDQVVPNVQGNQALRSLIGLLCLSGKTDAWDGSDPQVDIEVVMERLRRLNGAWDHLMGLGEASLEVEDQAWVCALSGWDLPHSPPQLVGRQLQRAIGGVRQRLCSASYPALFAQAQGVLGGLIWENYGDTRASEAYEVYGRFLGAMVERSPGPVVPIFTTNYDRALEELFKSPSWRAKVQKAAGTRYLNLLRGFHQGDPASLPVLVEFGQHPDVVDWGRQKGAPRGLLPHVKLHGSLGWVFEADGTVIDEDTTRRPETPPALLGFGEKGALEADLPRPFDRLDAYLAAALGNAHACIVVGYSNRDARIAQHLKVAAEAGTRLFFVLKDAQPPPEVAALVRACPRTVQHVACSFGGEACIAPILEAVKPEIA